MYSWPLNVSNFTWLDRLKISKFFLNPKNFWTQGKKVSEFEAQMAKFMGYKYAIFVSSGSAANTILAMYVRDKHIGRISYSPLRKKVILPSTTWQTSASPWIREGFEPRFIDVHMKNFGMDLNKLEEYLFYHHNHVAAVFPTSLLGCNLEYNRLANLKTKYPDIYFAIDQCENNFGHLKHSEFKRFTCTTSTYFGHQIQSVEGGFLLTNNFHERDMFQMYRNHGMTRGLESTQGYRNPFVDPRFDFHVLGNNFRNSEVNALIGMLDFKRKEKYIIKRSVLSKRFCAKLDGSRFYLPQERNILFCLPIILKPHCWEDAASKMEEIKDYCDKSGIEYRPIISGFLGYQKAYIGYMSQGEDYTMSKRLHRFGIYVGLHTKLKEKQVDDLVSFCNKV